MFLNVVCDGHAAHHDADLPGVAGPELRLNVEQLARDPGEEILVGFQGFAGPGVLHAVETLNLVDRIGEEPGAFVRGAEIEHDGEIHHLVEGHVRMTDASPGDLDAAAVVLGDVVEGLEA